MHLESCKCEYLHEAKPLSDAIDGVSCYVLTIMPTEPPIESPITMLCLIMHELLRVVIVYICSLQCNRLSRSVDSLIPFALLDLTHGGAVFQLVIPCYDMESVAWVVRPLIRCCEPVA